MELSSSGRVDAIEQLVNLIGREGSGTPVAIASFGVHFGRRGSVQVNGLETAYHDPRGVSGMRCPMHSPRGACITSRLFFCGLGTFPRAIRHRLFRRHDQAEKSATLPATRIATVFNSIVMCIFANTEPEMQVN